MGSWVPLLDREKDCALWQLLSELLENLRNSIVADPPRDFSLAAGNAGMALPFFYAAADPAISPFFPHAGQSARQCLAAAVEQVSHAASPTLSLFGGLPGIAWVLGLYRQHIDASVEPGDAALAGIIADYLQEASPATPFDLIDGVIGLAVYVLERPALRSCPRISGGLCRWLGAWARRHLAGEGGEFLACRQSSGLDGLGIAHGLAGLLVLLTRLGHWQAAESERAKLAGQTVAALLKRVPCAWDDAEKPAALAWCHGALSLVLPLRNAGLCFAREDWRNAALQLAMAAARKPRDRTQIVDSGFCHGAAGVAHLFNRLYQATGQQEFRVAALYWYRQILELRVHDGEWAGLLWYDYCPVNGWRLQADRGFLTGCSGVILSLQAGFSSLEPFWDRALLLSGFPSTSGGVQV